MAELYRKVWKNAQFEHPRQFDVKCLIQLRKQHHKRTSIPPRNQGCHCNNTGG